MPTNAAATPTCGRRRQCIKRSPIAISWFNDDWSLAVVPEGRNALLKITWRGYTPSLLVCFL
jgi:hypothetical protein